MEQNEKLSRKAEAVRRIYRTKGIDLSEDQGIAIASQLGKRAARAAILCGVVILALVAFLITRFVL
jgi:hypothetical protein